MDDVLFTIIPVIVPIFAIIIFIIAFIYIFSPKLRAKMMGKQIREVSDMIYETKDDLRAISNNLTDVSRDAMRNRARAVSDGLTGDYVYCKHCGISIDSDSRFCKSCGKEQ